MSLRFLGLTSVTVAGFTPNSISGLFFWTNPRNLASLSLDGSDNVNSWSDLSSSAFFLTAAGGQRPVWSATAINGNPGVNFATGHWLDFSSSLGLTGDFTIFFIYQPNSTAGVQSVLGTIGGGGNFIAFNSGSVFELNSAAYRDWNVATTAGVPLIWQLTGNGGSASSVLTANQVVQTVTLTSGNATSFAFSAMGSGYSVPFQLNGILGDVIVYNRNLTTDESDQVYAYLASNSGFV